MGDKEKIFVFGASGHAKVVIDIIERQGLYEIAFLADDNVVLKGTEFFGYPVIGGKEELLAMRDTVTAGIVAIGSRKFRSEISSWLAANRISLISAIHPSAQLARGVTVGSGTVVMAGAVVNSDCSIGYDVIINTNASVDHDCTVGDGVHIAPGAVLCGGITVGDMAFVCAGASIAPNITIGDRAVVGAGATVIYDVPDGVTVVGTPARLLEK
jgi:sugar O-acyltransferase (sialic acid O-acetyltransferase NeuD family)